MSLDLFLWISFSFPLLLLPQHLPCHSLLWFLLLPPLSSCSVRSSFFCATADVGGSGDCTITFLLLSSAWAQMMINTKAAITSYPANFQPYIDFILSFFVKTSLKGMFLCTYMEMYTFECYLYLIRGGLCLLHAFVFDLNVLLTTSLAWQLDWPTTLQD